MPNEPQDDDTPPEDDEREERRRRDNDGRDGRDGHNGHNGHNDNGDEDGDDDDDLLGPRMQAICQFVHFRRDGGLRPRFPFTDLPLWLGIGAVIAGVTIMETATYYGIKNQMMILFAAMLAWLLLGKKR